METHPTPRPHAPFDPGHGHVVADDRRDAQIRPVRLRQRPHVRPRAGHADQRMHPLVRQLGGVVVLEHQQLPVRAELPPQRRGPPAGDHRAGGILRAGGHDQAGDARAQRRPQPLLRGSLVVHGHRHRGEPERRHQVQQVGPAGVLDRDLVARPQVGDECPLEPVERPAGHREPSGRDAVGGEPLAGQLQQLGQRSTAGVADRRHARGDPDQVRRVVRQQVGVGAAAGQVEGAGGHGEGVPRRDLATGGRGRTRVPPRPAVSTSPRSRSTRYAAATVAGLTPRSTARPADRGQREHPGRARRCGSRSRRWPKSAAAAPPVG